MVDFLRNNQATCRTLLVEKTDRLYRNIKDWVTIDELGIEVHFVKEAVVLSDDSRSSEKFMHGIKVLMAKNYIDNLGEEVRKGMIEKARQGHWPTVAPVGYQTILRRTELNRSRARSDHWSTVRMVRLGRIFPEGADQEGGRCWTHE